MYEYDPRGHRAMLREAGRLELLGDDEWVRGDKERAQAILDMAAALREEMSRDLEAEAHYGEVKEVSSEIGKGFLVLLGDRTEVYTGSRVYSLIFRYVCFELGVDDTRIDIY